MSLINGNPLAELNPPEEMQSPAKMVADWMAREKAKSAAMGLWDEERGVPTKAGLINAARMVASNFEGGIKGYHGSPHSFKKFDSSKIGSGEGAQVYGHGMYVAENEAVAKSYRDKLAPQYETTTGAPIPSHILSALTKSRYAGDIPGLIQYYETMATHPLSTKALQSATREAAEWLKQNPVVKAPGHMYEVNINSKPDRFIDWDKPISKQSKYVQEALKNTPFKTEDPHMKAGDFLSRLETNMEHSAKSGNPAALAAEALREAGIAGVRYLDGGSRRAGKGSSNHVVFDSNTIDIIRKYGLAGLMTGGAAVGGYDVPD